MLNREKFRDYNRESQLKHYVKFQLMLFINLCIKNSKSEDELRLK